jgi:hypothetical protein
LCHAATTTVVACRPIRRRTQPWMGRAPQRHTAGFSPIHSRSPMISRSASDLAVPCLSRCRPARELLDARLGHLPHARCSTLWRCSRGEPNSRGHRAPAAKLPCDCERTKRRPSLQPRLGMKTQTEQKSTVAHLCSAACQPDTGLGSWDPPRLMH